MNKLEEKVEEMLDIGMEISNWYLIVLGILLLPFLLIASSWILLLALVERDGNEDKDF